MVEKKNIITLSLIVVLVSFISISFIFFIFGRVSDEDFRFLTGKVASRVLIANVYTKQCNMTLETGWNLISINCIPDNSTPDFVFNDPLDKINSIHTYDSLDNLDKWKAYNPNLPVWVVNDLNAIGRENGYWVNINQKVNFSINGTFYLPISMFLFQGWNLIGYPSDVSKKINESLLPLAGKYSIVYMYNASDSLDHWKIYNPTLDSSFSDLENMIPLYGYWINITENTSWYIQN